MSLLVQTEFQASSLRVYLVTNFLINKLIQKSYRHFLFYICSLQDLGELIKAYQIIVISVRLHDGSLRNGEELLGLDITSHLKLTLALSCKVIIVAVKLTIMVNTARSSSLLM